VADPGLNFFWGGEVQKVPNLVKYSVKQRETMAIGGWQMHPLPSPWIRHWFDHHLF